MSLVIFFGMALLIFLGGVTIMAVTFYHWYKQYRERQLQPELQNQLQNKVPTKA